MAYELRYHPKVLDDDLPKIPTRTRRRIADAVERKLATAPQRSGVPLSGSLRGYWKLRVGDYRIVFRLGPKDVWILAILHRRDVYERASRRSG